MKVGLDSHSPLAAQISHESSRFSQPAAVGGWGGAARVTQHSSASWQGSKEAGQGRAVSWGRRAARQRAGSPSRRPTFCVCCSTRTGFSPPVAKWPTWIHLAGRTRQTNEHSGGPQQGSTAGDDDAGQHGPAAARRAGARRGIACRQPATRGAGAPPQAGRRSLGRRPLDALDDWAGGVQAAPLELSAGLDAVEQHRVPLLGLGG